MDPFDGDLSTRLQGIVDDAYVERLVEMAARPSVLTEVEIDRVRRYVRVKVEGLQSLANTLNDPEDEEELHESLVTMWIELRSEWARHNKTVNYRRLIHEQEDRLSAAFGSACSNILRVIEPLIPNDLHRLMEFASAPLPAMSRPGRFADTNVVDRVINVNALSPVVVELAKLARKLGDRESATFDAEEWQIAMVSCVRRLEEVVWQLGVPTEVARVAIEERLLRLGERYALPLAPRITIRGTERLHADTVTRIIDSMEHVFESLRDSLTPNGGPVRSQSDFMVSDDQIQAQVSVLPSFFAESGAKTEGFDRLKAEGVDCSFDPNAGLSLKYRLERVA